MGRGQMSAVAFDYVSSGSAVDTMPNPSISVCFVIS